MCLATSAADGTNGTNASEHTSRCAIRSVDPVGAMWADAAAGLLPLPARAPKSDRPLSCLASSVAASALTRAPILQPCHPRRSLIQVDTGSLAVVENVGGANGRAWRMRPQRDATQRRIANNN